MLEDGEFQGDSALGRQSTPPGAASCYCLSKWPADSEFVLLLRLLFPHFPLCAPHGGIRRCKGRPDIRRQGLVVQVGGGADGVSAADHGCFLQAVWPVASEVVQPASRQLDMILTAHLPALLHRAAPAKLTRVPTLGALEGVGCLLTRFRLLYHCNTTQRTSSRPEDRYTTGTRDDPSAGAERVFPPP